jgi:hypothetical protein
MGLDDLAFFQRTVASNLDWTALRKIAKLQLKSMYVLLEDCRMSRLLTFAFGFLATLGFAASSFAQTAMDEMYGIGVHSYFSNNLTQAELIFTQLIDGGSEDPRVHFFRGITQSRIAGSGAGQADFDRAAELEMQGKRAVDVGRALQRIQGSVRTQIEKSRQAARLAYATQKMMLEKTRIEKLPPGSGVMPKDPFGDDPSPTAGTPQEMPKDTTPAIPPAGDEPGTDPTPGAEAPGADPFDTPSSEPDPFGGDAPAGDTPPAEGTTPPTTDEDPFG